MRRAFLAVPIALAMALVSSGALANGRYPAANQLAYGPNDPQTLVLRTTFGLILSRDGGSTWTWICEQGTIDGGYGGPEDPAIGITANDSILSGLFEGLVVSPDTGCNWLPAGGPIQFQPIADDVVRPDTPSTALALTNVFAANDDAGNPTFTSQVYQSTDNGGTWSLQGVALDPQWILETLEVAKSDPKRIYVSGVSGSGTSSSAVLLVSEDSGATWTPRAVPLDPTVERAPFIAAVDPSNADVVYVRTSGTSTNRLFVTKDAGMTFDVVYQGQGPLLGFALSPDGTKVWVGGPMDGLLEADSATLTFTPKSAIHVQCLTAQGTTLYACSDEASGFILGKSADDGSTFTPMLHLSAGISGPIVCPSSALASVCTSLWPALVEQLGIATDAGTPVPGADGGKSTPPPASGGGSCKCDAVGVAGGFGGVAGLLVASGAAAVVGRRKRRPLSPQQPDRGHAGPRPRSGR